MEHLWSLSNMTHVHVDSGLPYCILLPNGVPFDTNFLSFSVFSLKAGATELLLGRTNV